MDDTFGRRSAALRLSLSELSIGPAMLRTAVGDRNLGKPTSVFLISLKQVTHPSTCPLRPLRSHLIYPIPALTVALPTPRPDAPHLAPPRRPLLRPTNL